MCIEVGDLVRYTHFLKRKYTGVAEADLRNLVVGTDWEEFIAADDAAPFTPADAARFPFIDHSSARAAAPSALSDSASAATTAALRASAVFEPPPPPPAH